MSLFDVFGGLYGDGNVNKEFFYAQKMQQEAIMQQMFNDQYNKNKAESTIPKDYIDAEFTVVEEKEVKLLEVIK